MLRAYSLFDLVQIMLKSCGKIIQAGYCLPEIEQSFQKIGANEAGTSGDQPGSWILF